MWLIVGIAALAAMALAAGVLIGSDMGAHHTRPPLAVPVAPTTGAPQAAPPPPPLAAPDLTALQGEFAQLEAKLHTVAGIALGAVGTTQPPIMLGDWQTGPAWSTIKVPLVAAALRESNPPKVTEAMTAAITESDNAAAESIWAGLGDPVTAAHKVEAVLRQTGDPTTVESQRVRPEFTAFGQTMWSLTDQLRFTAAAVCDKANAPIFALMGRVEPDQRWGIGTVPGTQFKGGWGPSPTGSYLVRQLGVLPGPNGMIAVALAAQPASGKFEDGTADLTEMANWLSTRLGALPAGQCGP